MPRGEPELIGTHEFRSPINLETTWTETRLSEDAKSIMRLYYYRDTEGYIEWVCPELEREWTIGLTFEFDRNGKRTVVEYDNIFSLPDQAMDLLEKHGVDCAEMRRILAPKEGRAA